MTKPMPIAPAVSMPPAQVHKRATVHGSPGIRARGRSTPPRRCSNRTPLLPTGGVDRAVGGERRQEREQRTDLPIDSHRRSVEQPQRPDRSTGDQRLEQRVIGKLSRMKCRRRDEARWPLRRRPPARRRRRRTGSGALRRSLSTCGEAPRVPHWSTLRRGEHDQERDNALRRDEVLAAGAGRKPAAGHQLAQMVVQLAGRSETFDGAELGGGAGAVQHVQQHHDTHRVGQGIQAGGSGARDRRPAHRRARAIPASRSARRWAG